MPGEGITESWKEKNYEYELTELFFQTTRRMGFASQEPTIENMKLAFSSVRAFANALIYNSKYRGEYESKVKPVLEDINIIIFGEMNSVKINNICMKYNVKKSVGKFKQIEITNIPAIITELWECLYLLKQWAYEMGFFAKKPWEKQFGKSAMQDVFNT